MVVILRVITGKIKEVPFRTEPTGLHFSALEVKLDRDDISGQRPLFQGAVVA